ncbi:hypothetical protein [[Eubacterium] cellulosolvens]
MRLLKILTIVFILFLILSPVQSVFAKDDNDDKDKDTKDDKTSKDEKEENKTAKEEEKEENKTAKEEEKEENKTAKEEEKEENKTAKKEEKEENKTAKKEEKEENKTSKKTDDKIKPDDTYMDPTFGSFARDFLTFDYNLGVQKLENLSVYGIGLFSRIFIENGSFNGQKVSNNLFKGNGEGVKLLAHDNPLCLIEIQARATLTVHLNLTTNFTINYTDSNITLHNNSVVVTLRLLGKPDSEFIRVSDLNITVMLNKSSKLQIRLTNLSSTTKKEDLPGILWSEETSPIISKIIDDGYFGGDATITGAYGEPEVEINTYLEDFALDIDQIDINTYQISLLASSNDSSRKVVMVSLLKDTLGLTPESDVLVFINKDQPPLLSSASDFETTTFGYYMASDSEMEQILISVPHFSEQTITIQFIPEPAEGSEILTKIWTYWDYISIIGILFIIMIASVYLYTSRKEKV